MNTPGACDIRHNIVLTAQCTHSVSKGCLPNHCFHVELSFVWVWSRKHYLSSNMFVLVGIVEYGRNNLSAALLWLAWESQIPNKWTSKWHHEVFAISDSNKSDTLMTKRVYRRELANTWCFQLLDFGVSEIANTLCVHLVVCRRVFVCFWDLRKYLPSRRLS